MNGTISTIVIAVISALTSGGIFVFAQFLITRHDDKQGINGKLEKLEKDGLRTQLLLMILLKPEAQQEILTLGERYFNVLKGNWYMTGVFKSWCDERGLKPEWFNTKATEQ